MTDQPDYSQIRLQIDGWIARLTFARPARRNALTFEMMVEIKDAIERKAVVAFIAAANKTSNMGK